MSNREPMRFRLLRIFVPTAGMSILLLLLGGVAAWYLDGLQRSSSELLNTTVEKVVAAEELEVGSHQLRYQLFQYKATRDPKSLAEANRLRGEANQWLTKAAELADLDSETEFTTEIDQGYQRLFQAFEATAQNVQTAEQQAALLDQIHDLTSSEILEPAEQLRPAQRGRR